MFDTLSAFVNIKYPSGTIKESGLFLRGTKHGVWKEFDKKGKLVAVKYYYDKNNVTVLDKEDFNLNKTYIDDICVNLPAKWIIEKKHKTSLVLAVKSDFLEKGFSPTIVITKSKVPKEMDFSTVINLNKRDMLNGMDEFVIVEENDLVIANNKAYQMIYSLDYNNERKGVLQTFILNGNTLYNMTCLADSNGEEFNKYKPLFKEITNSFKIATFQSK